MKTSLRAVLLMILATLFVSAGQLLWKQGVQDLHTVLNIFTLFFVV